MTAMTSVGIFRKTGAIVRRAGGFGIVLALLWPHIACAADSPSAGDFGRLRYARMFTLDAYTRPLAPGIEFDAEKYAQTMADIHVDTVRVATSGNHWLIPDTPFGIASEPGDRDISAECIATCKPHGMSVWPYSDAYHGYPKISVYQYGQQRHLCATMAFGESPTVCHARAYVYHPKSRGPVREAFINSDLPYKNPELSTESRVDDLIERMTLEEKIAQLHQNQYRGSIFVKTLSDDALENFFQEKSIGGMSVFVLRPERLVEFANKAQDYVKDNTRLGIPLLIITETLHGLLSPGTTVYPQTIAQGSTWNIELIEEMAAQIAREGRTLGVIQSLSPMVTLARDPRWGRVEECFGECPNLVSAMALAYVRGMQGKDYPEKPLADDKMLCMSKVMAAYETPRAGINIAGTSLGERELRSVYLIPHEILVRRGKVASLMPSYHCIDGIPAHANKWLLTDVLRGEWGFDGYLYADWGGVGMNYNFHKIAKDYKEAAELAIKAGMDMEAPNGEVYANLSALVKEGRLSMDVIDASVRRVLRTKFRAGLFDNAAGGRVDKIKSNVRNAKHKALARRIAEESIILLKNEKNLLPLDPKKIKRIALIGPNANQVQFGDYSAVKDNKYGVTIKQAMEEWKAKYGFELEYARGCHWVGTDKSGFGEAVKLAEKSDIAVVVVGDTSMCIGGGVAGATDRGLGKLSTCGEGFDRTTLTIPGPQEDLVKAVCATGKPVILVMVNGRPFAIPELKRDVPVIVEAFYPGEEGGHAVADILFGKVNPSGRLTVSIPQSVGHIPCTYDFHPADQGKYGVRGSIERPGRDYVFSSPYPLWNFGFGLSYTTFSYSELKIDNRDIALDGKVCFSFTVANTGKRSGKEVAQIYYNDEISSTTTPTKRLIRFKKIDLDPGESRRLSFTIDTSELAVWNRDMKKVIEPGAFTLMVGASAVDIRLSDRFFVASPELLADHEKDRETPKADLR